MLVLSFGIGNGFSNTTDHTENSVEKEAAFEDVQTFQNVEFVTADLVNVNVANADTSLFLEQADLAYVEESPNIMEAHSIKNFNKVTKAFKLNRMTNPRLPDITHIK